MNKNKTKRAEIMIVTMVGIMMILLKMMIMIMMTICMSAVDILRDERETSTGKKESKRNNDMASTRSYSNQIVKHITRIRYGHMKQEKKDPNMRKLKVLTKTSRIWMEPSQQATHTEFPIEQRQDMLCLVVKIIVVVRD